MTRSDLDSIERAAYDEERAYWLRHADDHFDEADLPFIRWHQRRIIDNFAVPPDAMIVEVGCGAGKLFRSHGRVLALDFSPEILAHVKRAFPHYDVVCASVDALPFRDGTIQHLAANNMLHHVKGEGLLDAAVDEFARVLATDGRLYVNDRNPTLLHHAIILITMTVKHLLRRLFGEFGGCGSFHEPLFTRRDWDRIGRRFRFRKSRHYYSAAMWSVDSFAKGLNVVLRRSERGLVARLQARTLPSLLALERRLAWRGLCLERSVVAEPTAPPPSDHDRRRATQST